VNRAAKDGSSFTSRLAGRSWRSNWNSRIRCNVMQGFSTRGGIKRDGVHLAIQDARMAEVRREGEIWLGKMNMPR